MRKARFVQAKLLQQDIDEVNYLDIAYKNMRESLIAFDRLHKSINNILDRNQIQGLHNVRQ